jgi:hypothetical protein
MDDHDEIVGRRCLGLPDAMRQMRRSTFRSYDTTRSWRVAAALQVSPICNAAQATSFLRQHVKSATIASGSAGSTELAESINNMEV